MKSRMPINSKMRQRIQETAIAETEKLQLTYIKLVLKITALDLYKVHGHGLKRWSRLLLEITRDLERVAVDYGLDCVMTELDNELRRIGFVDEKGEWIIDEEVVASV